MGRGIKGEGFMEKRNSIGNNALTSDVARHNLSIEFGL
jgi:hypothetical protein